MHGEASIGVLPGFQEVSLVPGEIYEGTFSILNPSSEPDGLVDYRITISPFSVNGEDYSTDFLSTSNYTQMTNWIEIDEPFGSLAPEELKEIHYKINVPDNALGSGQYAALIVRIEDPSVEKTGYTIISRNQVANIIYATIEGELERKGTIKENSIPLVFFDSPISAKSIVENTGNIHNIASYIIRVENFFSKEEVYSSSETPKINTIVPETSLSTQTTWEDTPALGIFRVTQSVSYLDEVSTYSRVVFVCPLWFLILWIVFLSSCVAWFFSRRRARKNAKKNAKDYFGPSVSR